MANPSAVSFSSVSSPFVVSYKLQLFQIQVFIWITILRLRTLFIVGVLNASFSSDGLTRSFLFKVGVVSDILFSFIQTGFFSSLFSNLEFLTLLRFHEIFQDNFMKLTVFLQVTTCAGQFVCLCFEKKSLSVLYPPSTVYWQNQNKNWASEQ